MARVDSGHETVTSEDDDSPTPRHSPMPLSPALKLEGGTLPTMRSRDHDTQSLNGALYVQASQTPSVNGDSNNNGGSSNCAPCKLSSRRFPITCESDLYRLGNVCTHTSSVPRLPMNGSSQFGINRSSSAIVCGEYERMREVQDHTVESLRRQPPKFTGTLNSSCAKAIIRPIAFKPTEVGNRLQPNYSSMKQVQSLERRNSDNFMRRNAENKLQGQMVPVPSNNNASPGQQGPLNSQRFGGSLCNVLPSKEFYHKGSTLHIDDVGITPLRMTSPRVNTLESLNNPEINEKLYSSKNWEADLKHLQSVYDTHLRTAHQRTVKLEQALAAQSCQFQQERRKLKDELDESLRMTSVLKKELDSRSSQLEEAEWAICLLKAQLKDCQGDQVTRSHEVVQLRSHVQTLASELNNLRGGLSQSSMTSKAIERENMALKQKLMLQDKQRKDMSDENETLRKKLKEMELRNSLNTSLWEAERAKWQEEQKRVLRYQKALQHNYVMTCQKAHNLSAQVETLTASQQSTPKSNDRKTITF